ncbi:MAG: 4Fe-4S binding protein [Clostridiales Family XIII bacterium]|nr:4Fe-4S binding protein [Clostridiales Family XIII bacterium]
MSDKNLDKMGHINELSPWQDITVGGFVIGEGNSKFFNTGDWRTKAPIWNQENCKQCLLCFPWCPDSSIPIENSKRLEFDMEHCKGCGICAKVCPFSAISMVAAGEEK